MTNRLLFGWNSIEVLKGTLKVKGKNRRFERRPLVGNYCLIFSEKKKQNCYAYNRWFFIPLVYVQNNMFIKNHTTNTTFLMQESINTFILFLRKSCISLCRIRANILFKFAPKSPVCALLLIPILISDSCFARLYACLIFSPSKTKFPKP